MATKEDKGNIIATLSKGTRRSCKRKELKLSVPRPQQERERMYGANTVLPHGLDWFQNQKESKYFLDNWVDKRSLTI